MEGSGITKAHGDVILIHHFLQVQVTVFIKFLQTDSKVFMKTNSERERENYRKLWCLLCTVVQI